MGTSKGKIRNGFLPTETALERVECESGIVDAEIISTAGETNYEFFSYSRQQPVFNVIIWYIMECNDEKFMINKEEGFTGGGFLT